ncbi:hypothetical protein NA56DRAFT_695253 [Hyaloscypha hepaticicola]|uniref:Yeast cell wall synthesis Kre9/Knh1-like N-terminal domain-containing protein n=1 Tax=Hyaloscypha hepaticicola TaxID=2082293 RepID=A0A2J6PFH6_9HELO|nr:hypothetical protein NA56DRAFT_695253 [Hyaloscypha hepaticicola]
MSSFKLFIAGLFFVTVYGKAWFTNSQFNNVEVGTPFNITWSGNKNNVSLELRHGPTSNLILAEVIVADVGGSWYNWTPNANVSQHQNVLEIMDLDDQEPNYSLPFNIKGANASYVDPPLNGSNSTPNNSTDTSPSSKAGLSTTAKVALGVSIPVVVIVVGVCIGLWLRNRRNEARRGNHRLRTMSTDNTPTRYKSEYPNYSTPVRQELHSDPSTRFTPIKKLLFSEEEVDPTPNKESLTTWDDDFSTPPNNQSSASPREGEIHASSSPRYVSNYSRLQNEPDSPTPKRRTVSSPVREQGVGVTRQSPPPNEHWELSAGTPVQPRAELAQPTPMHEASQTQRNFSSPLPGSSSSSTQPERNDRDLYAGVTFGDSDNPDEIVAHLTAQRQKVRAEKERLRKLAELESVEDDIERQIEEARQKRG